MPTASSPGPGARPSGASARPFALGITYEASRTVLDVVGELDAVTAPALAAHLAALPDDPATPITLDLAGVAFVGAAGLGVIAGAAARAADAGRSFSVRSMTDRTRRTFHAGGLGGWFEDGPEWGAHSMPASNDAIDAALRLVTTLAGATVRGADGASVSLERHGALETVAANNGLACRMDEHQYDNGEGPCVEAATAGHTVVVAALRDETRWPAFVPLAIGEGIGSVLSTPLVVGDRSIGALNILSKDDLAFGPDEQELGSLFAAQASNLLTALGAGVADADQARQLAAALHSRAVLSQAHGVLMARRGIDADGAAALLHRWARVAETTVLQQATEIVESTRGAGPDA